MSLGLNYSIFITNKVGILVYDVLVNHIIQQTSTAEKITSILVSLLYLIGLIRWPHNNRGGGRAMWVFSHTKSWIFGYKLHLISSTGFIIVPLTANLTTSNISDNQMYSILPTRSLPLAIIRRTLYISVDLGLMNINFMISVAV